MIGGSRQLYQPPDDVRSVAFDQFYCRILPSTIFQVSALVALRQCVCLLLQCLHMKIFKIENTRLVYFTRRPLQLKCQTKDLQSITCPLILDAVFSYSQGKIHLDKAIYGLTRRRLQKVKLDDGSKSVKA